MKRLPFPLIAALLLALPACSSTPRTSQDPLSIARAPVAAAINDYQRCADQALLPLKADAARSVFVLADNAGHPYVAAFAEEASANIRTRTRNMLAHSLNRAREAPPANQQPRP